MKIKKLIKAYCISIFLLVVIFAIGCTPPVETTKEPKPKPKVPDSARNCLLPIIEPIADPNVSFPDVRVEGTIKITDDCITWEVDSNKSYTLIWYEDSATFDSARREVTFTTPEGELFSSPKGKQFKIKNGDKVSLGGGLLGKERVRFIVPPCPDCPTLYWLVTGINDVVD